MRNTLVGRAAVAAALVLVSAPRAGAQMYEMVGTRAQGMGGAFVAVADDATATWWNPAGIATGALFSTVTERGLFEEPDGAPDPGPALRGQASGFALAYPALGLSYYRWRLSEIIPASPTGAPDGDRQDQGVEGPVLRSLAATQYGATFAQTITSNLVIGSTLKLVRGGLAVQADTGAPATGAIDRAHELQVDPETVFDLDVGAMATMGRARVGVSIRHLREPELGEGATRLTLDRQARVGASVVSGRAGLVDAVIAAVDVDLTKTRTALGDVRHVGGGAEAWLFQRRLGIRGGVSANTVGEVKTSTSGGVSIGARGLYLDGALTAGSDESRGGWRLGLRVTF
jgi:hypothetical protein